MKIYLFRHGDKQDISSQDVEVKKAVTLSPLGIKQISSLAKKLASVEELKSLKCIYSSPYPRAIQSAEIIRNRLAIPEIMSDKRLGEYYAFNDYTKSKEHRQNLHKKMLTNPDFVSPETKISLNMYLKATSDFFKEKFNEGNEIILVSTHGALIRSFIYIIDEQLKPSDDLILDATIHEGGYSLLDFNGSEYKVIEFDAI